MSVIKTITRKLGEDSDKFDTSAYSKDSTADNFKEDYGFVPQSENERIIASREASMRFNEDYKKAQRQAILETENLKRKPTVTKSKKEFIMVDVEGSGVRSFKKGFSGKGANVDAYADVRELKKLSKEKSIAGKQVKSMLDAKAKAREKIDHASVNRIIKESEKSSEKISQKLRTDRLAKKELRVREYKDRLKRLKSADRAQAKVQKAIARALRTKSRAQEMSPTEYRAMYGRANTQNDGNLLHTPNLFTQSDNRTSVAKSNGNILQAPNQLLQVRKPQKTKWF